MMALATHNLQRERVGEYSVFAVFRQKQTSASFLGFVATMVSTDARGISRGNGPTIAWFKGSGGKYLVCAGSGLADRPGAVRFD